MKTFTSELVNPVVEQDILDLGRKINLFKGGKITDDKFRSVRLARGIYGQRQPGVQMIRIKRPYGKVTSAQLRRICEVSEEYSTGRLHITTRQDIQIHFVDVARTPQLWTELEKDEVTIREACGNTVRNVTASETAGIDVDEPFDVSPYAHALFEYFLRNPPNQEMGRKFKVSFSASDKDTGLSYLHDIGLIAKVENGIRGFKVLLGGGLGAQPRHADLLFQFLPADKIIPLMENVVRVFDRYGERNNRNKARMKFLIQNIGLDKFVELLREEELAVPFKSYPIDAEAYPKVKIAEVKDVPKIGIKDQKTFERWRRTNLVPQKQKGYVAIGIRVKLGDFYTKEARQLADLVEKYAAGEMRMTLRQNILIPYVKEELVPFFYNELNKLGMALPGYNTAADITACPGTDTCNLGIASSTGIAAELERIIDAEYPHYIDNPDVAIKISGCMNACGQHNMANIGFQGMSIRAKNKTVAPALQVLLGGGNFGDGNGRYADKVIKVPSKRGPQALRLILDDFEANANGKSFVDYYGEKGQIYFYDFLKPLADTESLTPEDFIDWGTNEQYKKAIGVGECAGVIIDLIATLFTESEEKIENAQTAFNDQKWAASIYHSYSSIINSAKALLLAENKKTNTHIGIIEDFDAFFVSVNKIDLGTSFEKFILQLNQNPPTQAFAKSYLEDTRTFLEKAEAYRKLELAEA
ncbi:HEPN domain-containing protein [Flavobacteriaceae bacterium F89]|uniref:HEPN domain-containing protein n=1 Tax=Cerina litoralis TaxID=2874477 RepID=A0AAE3JP34_9FLAO|nr:HEPN domain-containing protein [Cerina litoralis]MCG2460561.1 HEPN domain-containing protein [Cerina litoralis]